MSQAPPWQAPPSLHKPKKLVIFDIDGTLLVAGGIHRQAFFEAFKKFFGKEVDTNLKWKDYAGRTDYWILKDMANDIGIISSEITARLPEINMFMVDWYNANKHRETGTILPGVKELLSVLDDKGYIRALTTGNLEWIAYHKLNQFGIAEGFALGGFGSDHEERAQLLRVTLERARKRFGFVFDGKNAVYVADTPRDVHASHEAGIPAVVALTRFNHHLDFSEDQPELLLDSMEDVDEFFAFLENL